MYENRKLGFMYVLPFVIGVALFKRRRVTDNASV